MSINPPKSNPESDDNVARRAIESAESQADAQSLADTETVAAAPARISEGPGTVVGRYKLLQQIGEGGFGVVYLAEQKQPVRRKVALKIIKLGMDTKQVIARFEAERQALAIMDHPNIARVLDAGATDTGRPFFVMELVKGVTITEYCDTESLSTRDRLYLFVDVCRAVQHAHQKGIIHRDLKPSNVMITLHDGKPVPKVIDFGIAKATNRDLTDKTLFTEYHQLIGTPAYMSPEQAEMSGLDLDTRSDIYSLGVLLYELLTGTTPFSSKRFRGIGLGEIQRVIREEEPHKPSTRLSEMSRGRFTRGNGESDTATGTTSIQYIAKHRRTDIVGLQREIRGDLDWIIMKCLEKDRTRRYETATGLARDVERHLSDEVVAAGPPSRVYWLRKAIRRNKGVFVAIATVFAALVVGMIVSTVFYFRAEAQRRLVDDERLSAWVSERRAQRERDESLAISRESEAVTQVLAEMLATLTPDDAGEAVSQAVGEHFKEQPLVEARVRTAMISKYLVSDRLTDVDQQFEEVMAIEQRERRGLILEAIRNSLISLAPRLLDPRQSAEARKHILQINRRVRGEEHPDTLNSMSRLANDLSKQGKYSQAEELDRKTLDIRRRVLGEEHPDTLGSMSNLAVDLHRRGKYSQAEELNRKTLDVQRRVLGEEHPLTLGSMSNLANALSKQGKYSQAEELNRKTLDIRRRVRGEEHPDTLASMSNLANALSKQGKYSQAEELNRKTLDIKRRVLGAEHPDTLASMSGLLAALNAQEKFAEARSLTTKLIELRRQQASSPQAGANDLNEFAYFLLTCKPADLRDPETALPLAVETVEKTGGKNYEMLDTLALAYQMTGDIDKAVETQRKALALLPTDTTPLRTELETKLGEYLVEQGGYSEAEPLLLDGYKALTERKYVKPDDMKEALERIVKLYESWDKPEKAAEYRAMLPVDDP